MKMKNKFKGSLLVILFLANFLIACSRDNENDLNSTGGNVLPTIYGDGTTRGYKQSSILDMVLIYQGGVQRVDWTPQEMRPYVVHTNRFNQKNWFFDGFLFLEFQDGKGYNYSPGYSGTKNARKQEWEWLINRHFEDGKAIKSLNTCIKEAIPELGKPSFKHKVVIGLPEPIKDQKDWGSLDGKVLDFSKREDRITATKWYIDQLIDRFNKSGLDEIELSGFYWVSEHMGNSDKITADIGEYIREKGKKFMWIPYYMSNGYSQWKEYGFDIAYLQPNYFFNEDIGDDRVNNACDLAYAHNMGMEMEFDHRALGNSTTQFRYRLENYIHSFKQKNVFKDASIAYYEGGRGLFSFSQSALEADKMMIDTLAYFIKERRSRLLESLLSQENFTGSKGLDKEKWTVIGNEKYVTPTANGLVISSGGSVTKIQTRNKIDLTYGRIEVRAAIRTQNKDTKIRIHLMPTAEKSGGWPASGELFLMYFNGNNPSVIRVGANTDKMNENLNNIKESVLTVDALKETYHTFVCEWEEKKISFYVDGLLVNIQEDLFNKIYSDYPKFWPFNEKFYLEISVLSPVDDAGICLESIKVNGY